MGSRQVAQGALFYEFSLEEHVPQDHLIRAIDRFVDLGGIRRHLAPFYSNTGRPSVDPELMIRMLLIGYCFGIRSERRICDEVHFNLAYRWFCRLDLTTAVPDHSTFSKNRHGRFRDSNLLREVFGKVVHRCIAEGLVGGGDFASDASLIRADAAKMHSLHRLNGTTGRSARRLRPVPSANIWKHSTMPLSGQRLMCARSSSPAAIRQVSGRRQRTGLRSSPVRSTI